jgi:peptidylprolyl isomerase
VRSGSFVLPLLAAASLAGACGSKSPSTSADRAGTPGGNEGTKPVVAIPAGPPPTTLVIKDLRVGTGAEAVSGKNVVVQYVGVSWSTGKQFDASWDRNQPLPFQLGSGGAIKGWDQGIVGMRVGGRRELIIPPDLAYSAAGYPPDIGPNETLVFVIDLLSVQ